MEGLTVSIPRELPGHTVVRMVGSVTSISEGEVDRSGREIQFISGPTWFNSPFVTRRVFFMTTGNKPEAEATFQGSLTIRGKLYDVFLEIDEHNRKR